MLKYRYFNFERGNFMKTFMKITALVLCICVLFAGSAFYAQSDVEVPEAEQEYPQFAGGTLVATQNDAVDGELFVYENTTASDFDAYCTALENAGYTLKYNYEPDYGKFAGYTKDSETVYFHYVVNNSSTRVIRDTDGVFPEFEEKYTKRQVADTAYFTPVIKKSEAKPASEIQPKITQINVLYSEDNHGMAYALTLGDGSFILIDGGNTWEPQHVHLWNVLNEINERPDGKIIIRAWIFTHDHVDHTRSFLAFAPLYGSQCQLDSVIFNGLNYAYEIPTLIRDALQHFGGAHEFIVPHAGQRMAFVDSVVEIISTHEDIFPIDFESNDSNDGSTIFRVHLGGQTIMFTGDAQVLAGNTAIGIAKDYLAADFVQVSHHGYGDIGYDFYKEVGASFGFWPHEIDYYEQYSRESTSEVDRTQFWSEKNMIYYSMNHIEVADPYTSVVALPFDFKYGEVVHLDIPKP